MLSISRALSLLAARDPEAVAVRCGDEVLTRRELDAITNRVARRWVADGLRVDDLVTVALPTGVDAVVATVAAWKAGATPAPLSPHLEAAERDAVLADARPALVVDGPVDRADGVDDSPLPDLAASSWKAPTSSGSTGPPRVVRAPGPARVDPDVAATSFLPRDAVQLVAAPLHHAAPHVYAFRGLMTGHELVLLRDFDAGEWLRLVEAHRVTWALLVPSLMARVWRHPARAGADVSSLHLVHLGARCPEPLKRRWLTWLGPERITEVYAGTESFGLTAVRGDDWLQHPGTVGRPPAGTEVRVVDPGPDGAGLVELRREGAPWRSYGDLGRLDADGRLFLCDRAADTVRTADGPVHPADVETVLDEHPEVRSSVVVGRSSPGGDRLHAVVETDAGLADVRAWAARRLPGRLLPATWEVAAAPLRDGAGKVRRSRYRS